ncbi:YihY/virulence factor BrkB family protein [Streptomyces sp. SPB162]|uniref:YihY/virulence factor BrkB family protein n=1 Tax=Streptomyces sp. SPB162 TaxID=2940560 RepID=UPI00240618ED|nr:YihY/virulence factor BrkB family protein [Streptomyces sp. SPB162]MDF9811227.1 YihY family inner membrane protein [Streptomyces sp. SPB162]
MGTATRVPQTRDIKGEELSGDEAWLTLRRYGGWKLVRDAFMRFRYADGFSHARALALQTVLSLVPLAIALIGLSTAVHAEGIGRVAELTVLRISSGPSSDVVKNALADSRRHADQGGQLALWFGLLFALVNVTTAMAQVERGANRIYGVERDRPFHLKYRRGLLMMLLAGVPLGMGSVLMVSGADIAGAAAEVYHWTPHQTTAWNVLRRPVGILLALFSTSVIFRSSPRRRQPGYTWLAFGAAVYLALWTLLTWLLSLYVEFSSSFNSVYGPLSAFISLLLWSYLTAMALFLGIAFAAQLEAVRARVKRPILKDPGV